ncbi:energy-coupling factor ABC transporter permease [Acuticoccus sp. I52.16.1]|uniref:energy-coupling factor ABC transporter permease n=1 Tax=Acuticoccus sp. I52.16.1 TaxID=2928472 RepID=UPI001FD433AB|nr:energy-coupling factor ABC transporter permease [Acuticoccus sp. I52.16.1]UOM35827.1 energy-coupling factor ABC transporter permease [Acuticoccus sp. I52.16.1]
MHIEPGVVDGAKMALAVATAAASAGIAAKLTWDTIREDGPVAMMTRSVLATAAVFVFFQVFPHYPVGISEVHLILGSTIFLVFGAGPAAIGLAVGLLLQGLFFAPTDLPMFFVNVTTLIVPLGGVALLAKRIIAPRTPYVDVSYVQALALSSAYQGGIVAWVAFWAFYGQGFGAANLASVASFGGAYLLVIAIEPLADLAVLAAAKLGAGLLGRPLVSSRVYQPA